MTLSEIVTAVRNNTKREDKDAVAKDGVRFAYQRCSTAHPFRGLVRTEDVDVNAMASSVNLPNTPVRVFAAYWINGTSSWRIWGRSREWVRRRIPNVDATPTPSYPEWGYLEGNVLNLAPAVNDAGIVRITYQYVPELVNDTDSNPLPLLDEALVSYSTAWVFKSVQMWNEANFWESNYNVVLGYAITADEAQPFDEKHFDIRGDWATPGIEPAYDPFAGHNLSWYTR